MALSNSLASLKVIQAPKEVKTHTSKSSLRGRKLIPARALQSPVPKWPPNHPEQAWIICQAPNPSLPTATGPCRFLKTTHTVFASLLWHLPLKKNKPKQNKQNENSATMFYCLDLHLTSHHVYRFPSKRSNLQITLVSFMQPSCLSLIQLPSHPINLRMFQIGPLISIHVRHSPKEPDRPGLYPDSATYELWNTSSVLVPSMSPFLPLCKWR